MVFSDNLPEILPFRGEFGAEINSFIPFIHWAHLSKRLGSKIIETYAGMEPFYFFLPPYQLSSINEPRGYVAPEHRPLWLPNRNDHLSRKSEYEIFPEYRARFRTGQFRSEKPNLIIHNKSTTEWGQPPINVLSPMLLDCLFTNLARHYQIVYCRPGLRTDQPGYSGDHQVDVPLDDIAVLARHPDVILFDDLLDSVAPTMTYNELKLSLYADTFAHITVQGGNAHLLSLFSGGLVAIYHRAGQEIFHAYHQGHFTYAADPPPQLLICRTEHDVGATIPVFQTALETRRSVAVDHRYIDLLMALSPKAQAIRPPASQSTQAGQLADSA